MVQLRSRLRLPSCPFMHAPHFSVKRTMNFFHVSKRKVLAARLHAAAVGAGVQLERLKHRRFRMDAQKFAFLKQWTVSSFATVDGDAGNVAKQRTDIRLRLYKEYRKYAQMAMPGKEPISMGKFYDIMGDEGFCDQNSENCCCGQCVPGWEHIQMLKDFIEDTTIGFHNPKSKLKKLKEIRQFLASDYRWKHLEDSSSISTHCCNYALASPQSCFTTTCDHEHSNTCVECNMWPTLTKETRWELEEI